MKRREFKGEITVFLSIVFVLLLSLIGTLIQSASIHIGKSRRRAETQLALENYFAEYHDQMWEEYSILVREGADERPIVKRLGFYGAGGSTHKIYRMQLLPDGNGQAFYEQAVRFMGATPESGGTTGGSESTPALGESVDKEEEESNKALDGLLEEEGQELPEEDNPLHTVGNLKKSSLLSLIHPNPETLSVNVVEPENLASHRTLKKGSEELSGSDKGGVTEKALFMAYLSMHFDGYTADLKEQTDQEERADQLLEQDYSGRDQSDRNEKASLDYELEYLLQGEASDQENLEGVAKKILGARMVINYTHILSDSAKKAEADAMALSLTALFSVPAAKDIVKHALLLAWAYGESVVDLRVLFKGKKVPIVKTAENWQLQLTNLSKLGTDEESVTEGDGAKGMSYEDYLKGFLLVTNVNQLCMRALDLMELKLGIEVDECVTMLEIKSSCMFQRGIKDTFVTKYQYR